MKKIINIVSFGAGLNSAAMLSLLRIKKIKIDLVLMADPGSEEPETYRWIETNAKPYFKKNKLKFKIVKSKLGNIYNYHLDHKIIPFVSRRSCTDKFKIRPIKEYIKRVYSDYVVFCYIGYDADEPQRAKFRNMPYNPVYPLLQYNINRSKCEKLSQLIELNPPSKSRCFFCPFKKKSGFIELFNHHPSLYEKVIKLEENCSQFPKSTILNNQKLNLRQLRKQIKSERKLYAYVPVIHKLITDQRL